ncbi:MAG: hypothetical protein AB7S26_11520, partial [Sandaracinaceae bacterium]
MSEDKLREKRALRFLVAGALMLFGGLFCMGASMIGGAVASEAIRDAGVSRAVVIGTSVMTYLFMAMMGLGIPVFGFGSYLLSMYVWGKVLSKPPSAAPPTASPPAPFVTPPAGGFGMPAASPPSSVSPAHAPPPSAPPSAPSASATHGISRVTGKRIALAGGVVTIVSLVAFCGTIGVSTAVSFSNSPPAMGSL